MRGRVCSTLPWALLVIATWMVCTGCSSDPGKVIYRANCAGCHDTGRSNTPTLVDLGYWQERSYIPLEVRVAKTIAGDNTGKWGPQPPRGGNPDLSDAQVRLAIEWMLRQLPADLSRP